MFSLFSIGQTDVEVLSRIFNVVGTPSSTRWPSATLLPAYMEFEACEPLGLEPVFRSAEAGAEAVGLLKQLLALDPQRRISAKEALEHPYLHSSPAPCAPADLPMPLSKIPTA